MAVDASKAVERVYSVTSWPVNPVMNIFVPSLLNARPRGSFSSVLTLVPSTRDAPEIVLVPSPSFTVRVPSSTIVPVSFLATGASLAPKTVIVKLAVVIAS